jgi:hypothetical protein
MSSAALASDKLASPAAEAASVRTDARVSPIAKAVDHRNKEHLRFVAGQPCLICGRQPSDPQHDRRCRPSARFDGMALISYGYVQWPAQSRALLNCRNLRKMNR